jgi:hypothetical protein
MADDIAYFYALILESRWERAKPETRAQLEHYIWLASVRAILPHESRWGRSYELKPGEHMTQYLILGHAPLDVVYDQGDRIQAIFTSYE